MAGEVIEGEVVGSQLALCPTEARAKTGRKAGPARGPRAARVGDGPAAGLERVLAVRQEPSEQREDRSEAESEGGRGAEGDAGQLSPHQELPGKWEQYAELLSEGKDAAEAQRLAGVSPKLALRWIKREETAQRVVFLVRQRVRRESGKAQAVVSHLLDARSERVRLDAALAILDRSGVSEGASVTSPVTVVIDLSGR